MGDWGGNINFARVDGRVCGVEGDINFVRVDGGVCGGGGDIKFARVDSCMKYVGGRLAIMVIIWHIYGSIF